MKESFTKNKDVALEEMVMSTAKEAEEREKAKTLDKQEQLLSRALAVLASGSVKIYYAFIKLYILLNITCH